MAFFETAIGVFFLGLLIIGGWFSYPYVCGYEYIGTVKEMDSYGIAEHQLHIVTLRGIVTIGDSKTYILSPSGIKVGDYVMARGYEKNILGIGTVVIGTENLQNLNVAADVAHYSVIPFFIGMGFMGIGTVAFVIGLAVVGVTGTGQFFFGLWDLKKDKRDFVLKIILIFGGSLVLIGHLGFLVFEPTTQIIIELIGGTIAWISTFFISYRMRSERPKFFKGAVLTLAIIPTMYLGWFYLPHFLSENGLGELALIVHYAFLGFCLFFLFYLLPKLLDKN